MDSEVLVHRIARSASPTPEGKLADALQSWIVFKENETD
jgi:hypothetical protein